MPIKKLSIYFLLILIGSQCVIHANNRLHVYRSDSLFNSYATDSIIEVSYRGNSQGFDNMLIKTVDDSTITIPMSSVVKCEVGHDVPMISIVTDEFVDEIPDKENYLTAGFSMDGCGIYENMTYPVNIRGRGNSTWSYPKKPYRLKFNEKVSLCGFTPAKSYALLADYLDPTHMKNAVAFKVAQLLGLPYTNHAVPVNVTLNGVYRGAYMLTEKIGMTKASVNIEETTSVLFEIDTNCDETYRFVTDVYSLPVQVKDPDMTDSIFEVWKADFNMMINAVASDTADWTELIDVNSAVDYFIVYNLTGNHEVCWPKSMFLYKTQGGKYKFGPVWDFDWGFGYSQKNDRPLLINWEGHLNGTPFFKEIISDERFLLLYAQRWQEFKTDKLDELWSFIDEYRDLVEPAVARDMTMWFQSENFDYYVDQLKDYLVRRIEFIDSDTVSFGLY